MRYPITIEPDGKFLFVKFVDIPEAITQGSSLAEALEMAKDALESALDFYFEDQRPVPAPSKLKQGQLFVELSPSISAKVLLLNDFLLGENVVNIITPPTAIK